MATQEMSAAEREARQMIADKKEMAAQQRAYDAAKRIGSRDDNADKKAKLERMARQEKYPAETPTVDQMGNQAGMKNGGMTASRRADGVAQRGKTRGKMC